MGEEPRRVSQRQPPFDLVNLQGEGRSPGPARLGRRPDHGLQPPGPVHHAQGLPSLVAERNGQPPQEGEVILQTRDEGMAVMQVEMNVLAERADRSDDIDHVAPGAIHRILDVRGKIGQPPVPGRKSPEAQAGVVAVEPGRSLPHADMADVDAAADLFGVEEPLRQFDEPLRF